MDYAIGSTSLAHTFGNITLFMTECVKTFFPKNFFKTVHVTSTIAYRQIDAFKILNKEFIKKDKPILVIKPRIDLLADDVFMNGTFLTNRMWDSMLGDTDVNNLQSFVSDPKNGYQIRFLLNRIRVYFDITVITETPMEQINIAHYLKNTVRFEMPFMHYTNLESHIPKSMMCAASKIIQKPMYDSNGNTREFLSHVNGTSVYPITYKLKNSSGNDEFFRFYPASIETTLTGLTVDEGSKKGFVTDINTITFTVSTEFYTSGLYYFFTHNKPIIVEMMSSISVENPNGVKEIIPLLTVTDLYKETLPNGWKIYTTAIYKVEKSGVPDVLDLKKLFTHSLIKIIDYHVTKGIPISTFLDIRITKDSRELVLENNEYTIDYENLTLTTNICSIYSTYRFSAYMNIVYINSMLIDIFGLEKEK